MEKYDQLPMNTTAEISVSNAYLYSVHLLAGNNLKSSFFQSPWYLNSQNGSLQMQNYIMTSYIPH
jgi:hypothetical protein